MGRINVKVTESYYRNGDFILYHTWVKKPWGWRVFSSQHTPEEVAFFILYHTFMEDEEDPRFRINMWRGYRPLKSDQQETYSTKPRKELETHIRDAMKDPVIISGAITYAQECKHTRKYELNVS